MQSCVCVFWRGPFKRNAVEANTPDTLCDRNTELLQSFLVDLTLFVSRRSTTLRIKIHVSVGNCFRPTSMLKRQMRLLSKVERRLHLQRISAAAESCDRASAVSETSPSALICCSCLMYVLLHIRRLHTRHIDEENHSRRGCRCHVRHYHLLQNASLSQGPQLLESRRTLNWSCDYI